MTKRRQWALFILGAWLAGTLLSAVVAAENFYTIDRLLQNSSSEAFHRTLEKLGDPAIGRELLRYLSSELNRLYLQWWNVAQLALLVLALWLIRPIPNGKRAVWGIVAMLAVVIFLTLGLTSPIVN